MSVDQNKKMAFQAVYMSFRSLNAESLEDFFKTVSKKRLNASTKMAKNFKESDRDRSERCLCICIYKPQSSSINPA